MTVLLVGAYKKFNSNDYIKYVADAYIKNGINIIFDEQNFMFSNFLPDIVHIQWPEAIYRWKNLFTMDDIGYEQIKNRLNWYKNNNVKLVYTIHNLLPHDIANEFDEKIYNLIMDYVDIVVHHGKSSISIIKEKYPQSKNLIHVVAPHGPYVRETLPLKEFSRKKYNLPEDKFIFTNFGLQRSYKGQDFCYNVFKELNHTKFGFFSIGKLVGEKISINTSSDKFFSKYIYENVPTNEVVDVIAATDVFFLGHSSGINSGLIALALTYNKAIVFPNIGNFKDQVDGYNMYETYEVEDKESAGDAIKKIYQKLENQPKYNNEKWLQKNSWSLHVTNILKYCK